MREKRGRGGPKGEVAKRKKKTRDKDGGMRKKGEEEESIENTRREGRKKGKREGRRKGERE